MKKRYWLGLLMAGVVLAGCNNASTFDFNEFVDQYPTFTQPPTMTLPWNTTEVPTTVVEENVTKESETNQPVHDVETLYRHTVKIQLGEGKSIEDVCVTGDMVVYLVESIEENSVYITSASKGGDELIFSTRKNIADIACDEGRIVWCTYNDEVGLEETYLYEEGNINILNNMKNIERVNTIDIDGDYVLGFSGNFHTYTYDIVNDKLTEIPIDSNGYLYDYVCRWDYEDGYGGFACEANHIKIKDVYGNVVYEKQLEHIALNYNGNKNMIAKACGSGDNVFVDSLNGEDYSIKFAGDEVMVTGNWVFMWNTMRNTLKVFNPIYPELIWEMYPAELDTYGIKADKGQLVFSRGDDNTRTITVYTME